MKWRNIEGLGILGQIRVVLLTIIIVFTLVIYSVILLTVYLQGEDVQIYLVGFVFYLVIAVGLILFVYHHQKQLTWIAEERKKLEEKRRK